MEYQCMCYVIVVVLFLQVLHTTIPVTLAQGVRFLTLMAVRVPVGTQTNRTDSFAILLNFSFHANAIIVPQTRQLSLHSISLPFHLDIADLKVRSCKNLKHCRPR